MKVPRYVFSDVFSDSSTAIQGPLHEIMARRTP
jgi:hypothetical protein